MKRLKNIFNDRFWNSIVELLILLGFTFLPLLLNLVIALIPAIDKSAAIESKVVPGEMLAYCLSLIAPLFLFLLQTHGKSFKAPGLKMMFLTAFFVYLLAFVLTLIAKNGLMKGIDLKSGHSDFYFWISIISLLVAVILRFYTEYQKSRYSDYKTTLDRQQQDLNASLRNIIQ